MSRIKFKESFFERKYLRMDNKKECNYLNAPVSYLQKKKKKSFKLLYL